MADFELGEHGPYPDDWSPAARDFWDEAPMTEREFYNDSQWDDLQDAFERGWLHTGMTHDEHEAARQEFYDLAEITEDSFDWDAFREYLHSIGS